jgi:hypothetical protein
VTGVESLELAPLATNDASATLVSVSGGCSGGAPNAWPGCEVLPAAITARTRIAVAV